ncbi:MAG: hypothetical protein U0K66_00920 [Paludibacteraceae bacterium]|jgi:hypothetical protein|nr:hypothetical protein [Paludibacteraceae bacterium]
MDIISILSVKPLHKSSVDAIVGDILVGGTDISTLWEITCGDDPRLAWHAVWVMEVLCKKERSMLLPYRREIVEKILANRGEEGELRLWLNISLMLLPEMEEIDVDLLNFTLDNICNMRLPVAVRAVCIKIAYQLCRREPDLLKELQAVLSMLDLKEEQAAIKCVVKKVMGG